MSRYTAKPTTFEALVHPFDDSVQQTAYALRNLIKEILPDFDERIYGGLAVGNALYSKDSPNRVLCGIQPAQDHCKFYVHNVANIRREGLRIEGSGKHVRHVKVRQLDAESRDLLAWLLRRGYERWA